MDNFIKVIDNSAQQKISTVINMNTSKHSFQPTFLHQITENRQKTQMFPANHQDHMSFGHVNRVD